MKKDTIDGAVSLKKYLVYQKLFSSWTFCEKNEKLNQLVAYLTNILWSQQIHSNILIKICKYLIYFLYI